MQSVYKIYFDIRSSILRPELNPRVVALGPRDPGYYVFTLYARVPSACAYKVNTVARGSLGYYAGRFFIPDFEENILNGTKIAKERKISKYVIYFSLCRPVFLENYNKL